MLGSTFLLAQAHAPDAPQQETSYKDASAAPETSTSKRANCKQQAKLDKVATEVNFLHVDSSRIHKQGIVQQPLRHSCDSGAVPEEVQQVVRFLLGIGQVQAPDAPHQAAAYKDPSSACPNTDATAKPPSAPTGPSCAHMPRADLSQGNAGTEAARLAERDASALGLQCMDRLKHGLPFTDKDGNPLPAHVSGWHRDYFLYFNPSEESKRMHSEKNVSEMQALLEKETEMLLNALRHSEEPTSCIYELKCFCNNNDKYLCVVPDRACLGLQRRDIKRTKFQDRKKVSESFWWMFAAIEWEDCRVGSKRKKTT